MDYRIERKDAFQVIVKKEVFSTVNDDSNREIPLFWEKIRKDGTL